MLDYHVGQRIRELRELKQFTREVLAEKADISTKFLYEIEVRQKGFSAETLSRLAQVLSVSCDYIMYGQEREHRGADKIICVLEMLEPRQVSQMYNFIKILSDICKAL